MCVKVQTITLMKSDFGILMPNGYGRRIWNLA